MVTLWQTISEPGPSLNFRMADDSRSDQADSEIVVSGLREFFSHASYTVFEHQAQTMGASSMA